MTVSSTTTPIWLMCNGNVLCAARLATTRHDRRRGLRGTPSSHEPLVIDRCRWVHTLGMTYPLDVAYLSKDGRVVDVHRVAPWRVGRPVRTAARVIEAQAGSFERWSLRIGDTVEVRHVEH